MSPSWRDRLVIAVRPGEVRVQRHRRGWKRRSDAPVSVAVATGSGPAAACMQACMQALGQALPVAERRAFDVHVVLSNHFVRYAVVPGAADLRDPAEREAAARHVMAATYGEVAGRWRVVLDTSGAGDDALAAAIDEDLCAALAEPLRAAGAKRLQMEPLFACALNRCARSVNPRTGWLAVAERGRVVLASLANGELGTLRSHRLRAGMQAELPVLLEQGCLLENADPQRTEVIVAMDDEALALPADGQFQYRPVQLGLAAFGLEGGRA